MAIAQNCHWVHDLDGFEKTEKEESSGLGSRNATKQKSKMMKYLIYED